MSIRHASEEDVNNGATPIADVPDAPTIGAATNLGTSRAYNNGSATVAYTAATTGGTATTFTATSTPGSFTATGASPITVTGLQSATAYTFAVTGTNTTATSPASSASSSITATTIPAAPTIGTFTDGGTGTTGTLSFTAGATGGSAITNYKYSTDSSTYTALSPAQTSSPLSLTGLTAGTYNFSVKAVNANGDSAASSTVSGTVITPSSFESIATVAGTGASITFSSIPATYTHLQIRGLARDSGQGGADHMTFKFNNDSANNYSYHYLKGTSATTTASGYASGGPQIGNNAAGNNDANIFGAFIIDIIDYASTTKYKTVKSFGGSDSNSSDNLVSVASAQWRSTSAITSMTISAPNAGFVSGTTFALYGIK